MKTHDARDRRNHTMAIAGLVGVVVMLAVAGAVMAATKTKPRPFTETVVTASIASDGSRSVFEVRDSVSGHGAGVVKTTFSGTSYPLSGVDRSTAYFRDGVSLATDAFTIAKPNAHGISRITGKGRCLGGTGVYRTKKCTFTFSGTADTKPGGVVTTTISGTFTR
jgi:hypothetical protein